MTMKISALSTLLLLLLPSIILAGEADVVDAKAIKQSNGSYQFHVTLAHADEGWDHYANKWDIVGEDGTVYGTRTLYHPHINEQPFTRSLSNIKLPDNIKQVTVQAHDLTHQYGGKVFTLKLQ